MAFIELIVVFVALGLSILIFAGSEGVASLYLIFRLLCYLNFPPGLSNVIIPPSCCASILNFPPYILMLRFETNSLFFSSRFKVMLRKLNVDEV